ncbi:hypothetical protein HPB48_015993 [Haemaphysalis longicornis]|uniref:Uncharacterized protein n=1 Tax=Haemaphysalis longicornis TaxID=44386 RepID=A0A9J6G123_HAELO|nr:hypothetical protein HPB48_015993 [Haemaphysalis longicornis]
MPEAAWRGYPRLFTEKTSSLLSEALHMLHRAKDIQERRWLQTFVRRIAQLASDLERSTQFRWGREKVGGAHSSATTHALITWKGQISPPPSPSSFGHRDRTTTQGFFLNSHASDGNGLYSLTPRPLRPGSVQEEVRGLGKPEVVTQPNFVADESDSLTRQLRKEQLRARSPSLEERAAPGVARYTTETYSIDSVGRTSMKPTTPLDGREVSLILDKIQSLIGLGMSEEDVGKVLQKRKALRPGADGGSGRSEDGDKASTRPTLAPTESPVPLASAIGGSPRRVADDLVRQLEREKFLPGR